MKKAFIHSREAEASHKRAHGNRFEAEAARFLERAGYLILAKNITYPCGEIDLIAEETKAGKTCLVFVEVRKRDLRSWIRPEETLTYPKQRTLTNAIQRYLLHYRGRAQDLRIDLLAFDGQKVEHFRDFMRIN
ncbi:MAG: YraN family protein [Bdellovibrionales bacterium]|nr:YraN family protein [Oligoflexia bacterium]